MKNFNKFSSSIGLSTRSWGPSAWDFLFSSIMGAYPYKLNDKDKQHREIKRYFKSMFTGLKYTLPCSACRDSYSYFLKKIPVEPFLIGRIELMYWLYMIKDNVNKKLIAQELQMYLTEYKKLSNKNLDKNKMESENNKLKQKILYTKPSPPFTQVLEKYEKLRAKNGGANNYTCACSQNTKK
jgi:hypothetical protein